jgi:hypothetical protein
MSLNTADIVFLAVGLIDFGGAIVCIGVALHMAYTKMDVLLDHFKHSPAVIALTPLRHGGPWGKLLIVGGISGFVTFPVFYIKRGSISAEDINNLPAPIKCKFIVLQWCVIVFLLVMLGLAVVVEFNIV